MEQFTIVNHPLIHHKIALLRSSDTGSKEFRELAKEISMLICYEATRDISLANVEIETPVGNAAAQMLGETKIAIVPILRAGLGMVEGMLNLMPTAKVGHIGMYRDPHTFQPVEYYCKLPADIAECTVFVLDMMLATGGTASAAIQFLKDRGVKTIKLLSLIASPEGVQKVLADHPDLLVYTAAFDKGLDAHGYIVPGLGDAGDRLFGTK